MTILQPSSKHRYWVYQIARAIQALSMGSGTRELSQRHGEFLVWLEQILHLDIELPLQRFVLVRPNLLWFFNKVGWARWWRCPRCRFLLTRLPTRSLPDVRHGPHPSDDRLLRLLLLGLSARYLSACPTDPGHVQYDSLRTFLSLALHATPPPTFRYIRFR